MSNGFGKAVRRRDSRKPSVGQMIVTQQKLRKGLFRENCNRTACQRPPAEWFNQSTRAWYCEDCAHEINKFRPTQEDSLRLNGTRELCLKFDDPRLKDRIGPSIVLSSTSSDSPDPFVLSTSSQGLEMRFQPKGVSP